MSIQDMIYCLAILEMFNWRERVMPCSFFQKIWHC